MHQSAGPPGPRVAESVLRAYEQARTELVQVRFQAGPTVLSRPGELVLRIAERNQVPLESGCRMGLCGADAIQIVAGADHVTPPSPAEQETLHRLGLPAGCRMACTTRVRGDVTIAPISVELALDQETPMSEDGGTSAGPSLVIVGAGVAGVTAALEAREHARGAEITLLGAEPYDFYNRMIIHKLLPDATATARLSLIPNDWTKHRRIRRLRGVAARAIDRVRREVLTDDGNRLPYDRVLLATGARSAVPSIQGRDKDGVFALRTIDDALRLRQYIRDHRCRRAVVIGGGLLGLEAASSLSQMDVRVSVLESAAWPMPRQLDEAAGSLVRELMADLGIKVVPGAVTHSLCGVERIEEVELSDGRRLKADVVLLATGAEPDVELARAAGLSVNHGVIVDDHMATSDPDIFAAGDVASHDGRIIGLWPVGIEQARIAARNMVGGDARYTSRVPPSRLKVAGLDVLSVGDVNAPEAGAHAIGARDEGGRRYRKLVVRAGRAHAAILVGYPELEERVCEAVQQQADVTGDLSALERGDWHSLAIDGL